MCSSIPNVGHMVDQDWEMATSTTLFCTRIQAPFDCDWETKVFVIPYQTTRCAMEERIRCCTWDA